MLCLLVEDELERTRREATMTRRGNIPESAWRTRGKTKKKKENCHIGDVQIDIRNWYHPKTDKALYCQ